MRINTIEDKDLMSIISGYVERSEFYQDLYSNVRIESYNDIPTIDKNILIMNQVKYPPFGTNLCVDITSITRLHRTSGTTMKPLLLALTNQDIKNVVEAGRIALTTAGMGKGDIVFNCMNYCMWMGGFMDHQSIETTGAVAVPYGVGRTENLIDLLLEIEGPSIHSTPSYLNTLKQVLWDKYQKRPIELGIKKGFFGGESGLQDEKYRSRIEEEWGMKAINANYGLSEVMSIIGSECLNRKGLHLTAQPFLYTEIFGLESDYKLPSQPKQGLIGELVLTNLAKEAQPLIRYRTGDIIEVLSLEPCSCGQDTLQFRIVGRKDDMLVIKGINFYPESIRPVIAKHPEFTGNYVVRVPNRHPIEEIAIIIETQETGADDSVKEMIKQEIKDKYFINPKINFVDEIKPMGNKMKLVERV